MGASDYHEDVASNPKLGSTPTIGDVIAARYSRRDALGGMLGGGLLGSAAIAGLGPVVTSCATWSGVDGSDAFVEIARGIDTRHHVAPDHEASVLLRWGDPLFPDMGPFDPMNQSAEDQERRFGQNNDYIGFVPLGADRGILCVNHEYVIPALMHPGAAGRPSNAHECEIEKAAHGCSIVEVARAGEAWRPVIPSRYNRRITARTGGFEVTGPAAGHPRLRTSADPSGRSVTGTLNNCAGGITPWGTYLLAEENFNDYFVGAASGREAANYERYGIPAAQYAWGLHDPRFNLAYEPNEPNRFGWIVEIDPKDPLSIPKKRTALGRFKHEGAATVVNRDGRIVLYSGDDQRFDYVYKFVTAGRFDPNRPGSGRDLLDAGVLHAARFSADGSVTWLPLIQGVGPLTAANGFDSQADVVIETRRAADLLAATPMDRPEGSNPIHRLDGSTSC